MVHHEGGRTKLSAAGFELVSFQFSQKCPNIDLTLTACLPEIEMKIQYHRSGQYLVPGQVVSFFGHCLLKFKVLVYIGLRLHVL